MIAMAWRLSLKKIKVLYRRRYLKIAWLFVHPVAQLLVYTWVFSKIVRVDSEGSAYALFNFVALAPWLFFSACLLQGSWSLRANNFYITRLNFPTAVIPLSEIFAAAVPFFAYLFVLIVLLWHFASPLGAALLYLPVVFAAQLALTAGLVLLVSIAGAYSRSAASAAQPLLNLWLIASPVFYSANAVPERLKIVYRMNPMTPILNGYRSILLHNAAPDMRELAIAAAASAAVLIVGTLVFRRAAKNLADYL